VVTPCHRFTVLEITSGLADDSREADDRAAARALRDVRDRVKAARALVAATPGLRETLARDWRRAAAFYGRFDITEAQYRRGACVEWDLHEMDSGGASIARLRC
jgi:hypothetical protein